MRSLRPPSAAPCLAAAAEKLPFEDACFDAATAIATVHHWQASVAGPREMRRVARRVVVFTYDFSELSGFWLTREYVPEVLNPSRRPSFVVIADEAHRSNELCRDRAGRARSHARRGLRGVAAVSHLGLRAPADAA